MLKLSWEAAILKALSGLCFAGINGIVRSLSQEKVSALPPWEIAFLQNVLGLFWLIPVVHIRQKGAFFSPRWPIHGLRAIASGIGLLLWYTSLSRMPIIQTVFLGSLGPLITLIGARIFLKEKLTQHRILALLFGIIGCLFLTHGNFLSGQVHWHGMGLAAFIPIGSSLAFSASTLIGKKLTSYDPPEIISMYLMILMLPFLGLQTSEAWIWPSLWQSICVTILSALGALAHFSLMAAFKRADVTALIPFGATRPLASTGIGFFCFGEIPSLWTALGAFIILVTLLFLSYKERYHA